MTACPGAGTAHVHYRGADLYCEDIPLAALADRFGTPLYVYSAGSVRERVRAVRQSFGEHARICYAVKANGNRALLRLLAELGCGFDLVSGGELLRLQAAGLDPRTAVFAGVAKEAWEIELGVGAGVRAFHVESGSELDLLAAAARKARVRVPVLIIPTPERGAETHPGDR